MLKKNERLSDEILLDAGNFLFLKAFADAIEKNNGKYPPEEFAPTPPANEILSLMRQYEDQLAEAWGMPPKYVFALMDLDVLENKDDIVSNALCLILLQCEGHDMSMEDDEDYFPALERYAAITENELNVAPFDVEFLEFDEMAHKLLPADLIDKQGY